jgi:hypothetical protein
VSGVPGCEICGTGAVMCGSPTCWSCGSCGEHFGVLREYLRARTPDCYIMTCSEACKADVERRALAAKP